MCLSLNDAVEQTRAHHEATIAKHTFKWEQALAAKVCWTMLALLLCIYPVFASFTIDDSVQNDALAAKDAELEHASAALTSKVCLFYIGSDLLRLD